MRRHPVRPELLATAAALWLLVLALVGVDQSLAYMAPALLLVLPLLAGRYPGEQALIRALDRRPRRARRAPLVLVPLLSFVALTPRGGRLVAVSLAGRGPPPRALDSAF